MKKLVKYVAAGAAAAVGTAAHAAGTLIDPSAGVAVLTGDVQNGMLSIGVAIFTLAGIGMGISWVKATFFG